MGFLCYHLCRCQDKTWLFKSSLDTASVVNVLMSDPCRILGHGNSGLPTLQIARMQHGMIVTRS